MRKLITSIALLFFTGTTFSQTYDIYGLRYDSLSKAHFVSVDNLMGQITSDKPLVNVNVGVMGTSMIIPDSNQYVFAGYDTLGNNNLYTVDIETGNILNITPIDTTFIQLLEIDHSTNMIYGLEDNGTTDDFVSINYLTGQTTFLSTLPDAFANNATFNSKTGEYIFIGKTNQFGDWRIYTVNASSGTLITDTLAQSWFYMIEVDTVDGVVYGLRDDGSTYYFISIDPQSGLSTDISTLTDLENFIAGTKVFNSETAQYIFEGSNLGDPPGSVRYYTIDVTTGAVSDTLSYDMVRLMELYKNTNVSIVEHGLRGGIGVYPNPSGSDIVNVAYELTTGANVNFNIVDYTGKQLAAINKGSLLVGKYQERINIGELSPGFYFLTVTIGEELYTQKVIKL